MCAFAIAACSHPGGSGLPTGSAGTTGSGGNASPAGAAGTGNGGTNGPGVAGTSGSAGDGANGGNVGTTGSAGNVGTPGTGGDTSPTGTAGTSGNAGNTGSAGSSATGSAGTTGAAGTSGSAGTTGAAGDTGAGGDTGGGTNLIANGDFSGGAANWHTEMGTGNVNNGRYCVTNPSGTTLVGYDAPAASPLMLAGGTTYRISFQASGAGTVHLKVGMASSPYGDIFTSDDGINSNAQTYSHTFMPASSNSAGLAFTFVNAGTTMVCLDNVTLVQN